MWLFVDAHLHSMELLVCIRSVLCFCLFHLAATDIPALNIVVTCARTNEEFNSAEWRTAPRKPNPSPLHDLKVQLTSLNGDPATLALNITWSINIDSSIYSITGTWIELIMLHNNYRCEYHPPFTSKRVHTGDLEQLEFSFITTDVSIQPSEDYHVMVYNLPLAPPNVLDKYSKYAAIEAPGCDVEMMRNHVECLKTEPHVHWTIAAVRINDEIHVTFDCNMTSKTYDIRLWRGTHMLNYNTVTVRGEIETLTTKLNFSGPCENLQISEYQRITKKQNLNSIQIVPFFAHCDPTCKSEWLKIDCQVPFTTAQTEEMKGNEAPVLLIGIGCTVAIMLLFICQLWGWRIRSGYSRHGLDCVRSVGVLVVYPAVNSVFQNAVMSIADFLQSHRELNVIIDVWQRGSLAEQGPLRWLNSQVSCAEKVLIILPPQNHKFSTDTACLKPNMATVRTDYTVPASACELFSLALNLVASYSHDPQQHHKFLVVHLDHCGHRSTMPVELRSCKALILPKDLEKLHQLSSKQKVTISSCRVDSYHCKETARKVRDAVQQLDKSPL